jgi:hypothetical protein
MELYGHGYQSIGIPVKFLPWFGTVSLSLVASIFIAWCFMPGIVSDCRNGLSLNKIVGRLVTMTVCIMPVVMFLTFPNPHWGGVNSILSHLPVAGLACIVFALPLYKTIKASSKGRKTSIWVAVTLVAFVVLNLIPAGTSAVMWVYALARITAYAVTGGLTVLLVVMVIAIVRSFTKVS